MFDSLANASRFLLPSVFLGYALFANVNLILNNDARSETPSDLGFLEGGLTRDFEALYKTGLPHREPSIGLLGAARYLALGTGKPGVVVGEDTWFFTNEEFGSAINSDVRIARAVEEIRRIKTHLETSGTELVLVPLPHKSDVYSEHLEHVTDVSKGVDQYRSFIRALMDADIDVVDTRPVLLEAKKDGLVFYKTDTHWTAQGARHVAQAMQQLVQMPFDVTKTEFELFTQERREFWGDLISFVTDEKFGHLAGLEQERASVWRAEEVRSADRPVDLFGDDADFPVVLVGTSYSANDNWSFNEFLKAYLSVDVLNLAKEGQGPGTPMYAFLKGEAYQQSPPRLVIWEFPTRYLGQDTIWDMRPEILNNPSIVHQATDWQSSNEAG